MQRLTGNVPSEWGILVGVRPVKIARTYLEMGLSEEETITRLQTDYLMSANKAAFITEIAIKERPFLVVEANHISIYIGIPFCPTHCLYCSFPSALLQKDHAQIESFLADLKREIMATAEMIKRYDLVVDTLYIGGGTPTSLSDKDFYNLLSFVREQIPLEAVKEFTVEAGRPDTITSKKIEAMCMHGVTRISLNPQTMQEKTLKRIGRNHTVRDIIEIFEQIRQSSIAVINMDIIIGLPGETVEDVRDTMAQIKRLAPDNITIHSLAIKRASPLKEKLIEYPLPSFGEAREMFRVAEEMAGEMGMKPYYLYRQRNIQGNLENVGYAKVGAESIYNIRMIEERQTIIGMGPSSTTKILFRDGKTFQNLLHPKNVAVYGEKLDEYLAERDRVFNDMAYKEE
jgi:oxygen-independent coproporphyrinogen-3 oxidase